MKNYIIDILLVLSVIIGFATTWIVFLAEKKTINRFLGLTMFFGSIWGLSILLTLLTGNLALSTSAFAATALMLPLISLSMLSIAGICTKRKTILFLTPAIAMAIGSLLTGMITTGIDVTSGYIKITGIGPLFWPYFVFSFAYFGLMIYSAIISYQRTRGIPRLQIMYIAVGIIISSFFGFIFNLILPTIQIFDLNNLGPIFVIFASAATIYVATKHYLYDYHVVLSELWAFLLLLIGIVWLLTNLTTFNTLLFLAVLSLCILFIRSVVSEAEKRIALEKDKEELQELDKQKDEFLKMAQHELNTPIGIIEGKLSMIIDENMGGFTEKQKQYLKPVFEDSKRLAKLTKALVEVSELDQKAVVFQKDSFNLKELILESIEKIKTKFEKKGLKIELHLSEKIPQVLADKEKTAKILDILLDNSFKFANKGKITIRTEQDNNLIKTTVQDEGIGIKKEEQEYIFKKFFQANRFDEKIPQEQQGTGLSLYIAKKLVEYQSGQMTFESNPGQGSKFSFSLPTSS